VSKKVKDCQIGKIKELTLMPLMVREFAFRKREGGFFYAMRAKNL
jgi:hypothetical protein